MEKLPERTRKSKGRLSVLDEFTGDAGVIDFKPTISSEEQDRIDLKTMLADAPTSTRPNATSNNEQTSEDFSHEYLKNKIESKLSQSEAKVEPLHESKLSQSEAKVEPQKTYKIETRAKVEPQPEPLHESKLSQSEAKVEPFLGIDSLVGLQRNTLIFIFESCLNDGSKISSSISISNLAFSLESTVSAVRKAVQRLEEKGIITRFQYKDGRGGWTKYELPSSVYSNLLTTRSRAKVESKLSQSAAKVRTQPEPQPEPSVPYSSSSDFLKVTTITSVPENLARFGISTINLQNLISSGKASQEMVERSLAALSYDVENGKTGNIANILFGVLGKGREYISQKYSEGLQTELDQELARITAAEENQKRVVELKLKAKFQEHLQSNPELIEQVKNENPFINSNEVAENLAFEKFKQGVI